MPISQLMSFLNTVNSICTPKPLPVLMTFAVGWSTSYRFFCFALPFLLDSPFPTHSKKGPSDTLRLCQISVQPEYLTPYQADYHKIL